MANMLILNFVDRAFCSGLTSIRRQTRQRLLRLVRRWMRSGLKVLSSGMREMATMQGQIQKRHECLPSTNTTWRRALIRCLPYWIWLFTQLCESLLQC